MNYEKRDGHFFMDLVCINGNLYHYVAWYLFTRTPEMKVIKRSWILVTLYTGIIGKDTEPEL